MRILKMVVGLLALLNLAVTTLTGAFLSAVFLLMFSSIYLGIMLGEKMNGGSKYDGK